MRTIEIRAANPKLNPAVGYGHSFDLLVMRKEVSLRVHTRLHTGGSVRANVREFRGVKA